MRKTDKGQRRGVTKKEKGRRVKTEGATWWKCSGEGEIKELGGGRKAREEILKAEEESNGGEAR